jgi:serine/threonine protein phosphatase PrpC
MASADTPLCWSVLHLPKHGNADAEYEDAWAVDAAAGRFAVADGASETSFAARWAQLLTEGFIAAPRPAALSDWLADQRRLWLDEVNALELPWYAEIKREQGAFATFLGLGVRAPTAKRRGGWRAAAVGDSCLMQVRDGRCIHTFPVQKSAEFGNQPRLIGSRGADAKPDLGRGTLEAGDRLLLMTDALAQWYLQTHEAGGDPWEAVALVLADEKPQSAFADWIAWLRDRDDLRNDDVTLLAIESEEEPS